MDLTPYKKMKSIAEFDLCPNFIIIEDANTRENLLFNKAYKQEIRRLNGKVPPFDERFLSVNSYLDTIDGRQCVIEAYERVFPKTALSYDMDLRTTISHIESGIREEIDVDFLSTDKGKRNHDLLIDQVVQKTIAYYKSPYAHLIIFTDEAKTEGDLLQYALGKDENPKPRHVKIKEYWINSFANFFSKGYSLLCESVEGFAAFDEQLYNTFLELGIHRVLIMPFFIEGEMAGFLVLSNPKTVGGSFDFFLADFAGNAIGTLIYRGQLYSNLYFDSLTMLPWNMAADTGYIQFLNEHKNTPVVMMALDISRFRMISRSYGVAKADQLLVSVAGILKRKYPRSFISRRYGSDVFYIVTNGLAENLLIEAQNINAEIRSLYPEMLINMAFGIYQIKDRTESFAAASLKVAFAHAQAKEDPFLSIVIFDDEMAETEKHDQLLTDQFRKAIANEEFKVYIQPRYNLETNRYYSGEALVRWGKHDEVVLPGQFIPLFESNGLCHDLDLYVLKKVCELQAKWLKDGKHEVVPISVNYSRIDFADDGLFEHTMSIIKDAGIPANLIEIEITESAYVDFEQKIISFIEKCHAAGIRILMDDFGSGKSSFNSLKNLDIDTIKLDYKFLQKRGSGEKRRKIIESIISLSRSLGIPIVIEGVEEESDASYFRAHGVRYVQGFLFGKAMPIPEFEALANKRAEFQLSNSADSKMLLNEILDDKTNLNFFAQNFPAPIGIYRFDGNTLMPIFINQTLIATVAKIGTPEHFFRTDLLSMLVEKSRKGALECLRGPKNLYEFGDPQTVTFQHGVQLYRFNIASMLLKRDGQERYFLMTASPADRSTNGLTTINTFTSEQFERYFSNLKFTGYILTEKNGDIKSYNQTALRYYPALDKVKNVSDIFGPNYPQHIGRRRFYDTDDSTIRTVDITPAVIDDDDCLAISIQLMAHDRAHFVETVSDGFEFFDRALASLKAVAVYYTEIDLDEDRFLQVRLNDTAFDNKLFRQGEYENDYYPMFLSYVAETDRPGIAEKMKLEYLREVSRTNQCFELNYKIHARNRYFRVRIQTYYFKGRHYACFYSEDVTDMRMKDYDILTGLLARNAGSALMNRYISVHPIDKMAFIILDIDGFKALNDNYGHPLGDRVLAEIKDALATLPEEYDIVTRFGGDEFCLLLKKRPRHFSRNKVRNLLDRALAECGKKTGLDHAIHCSAGFALIPEDGTRIDKLYGIADEDLYRHKKAKKEGKETPEPVLFDK
ncbi:MAG: EAL domain-containing protein [Bacilli bacterium]|nr:EAL domain-containing protein [Bacilli bacterium]